MQNKSNPAYANEKSTLLTGYEVSAVVFEKGYHQKSLSDDWEEEESSLLMEFDKLLLRQLNVELGNNQLLKAEYVCSMIHSVAALKKAAYVILFICFDVQLAQKVESSSLVSRIEEMIEMKEGEVESIPQRRRQEDSFESRIQNEMKQKLEGNLIQAGDSKITANQ